MKERLRLFMLAALMFGVLFPGNRSDPSHFFTQQEEEVVHPDPGAEP